MPDVSAYPSGTLNNNLVKISYLSQGALRLVHCSAFGSPNLLAELPEVGWQTPHGTYHLLGGHRFWVAPESMDLTYLTEPREILEELIPGGVRLTQPIDLRCGLQKKIEIVLHPRQACFNLRHILLNLGDQPRTVAAWGITQFSLGGMAAFPQPANRVDPGGYLPNRSLTLWPYTRLDDPRLRFLQNYLVLRADTIQQPCKIGYHHPSGWGVYLHHGVLVRKTVTIQPGAAYPDLDSPLEMYIDHRFFELESLSPLVNLKPGNHITHEERFDLLPAPGITTEQELAEFLDHLLPPPFA